MGKARSPQVSKPVARRARAQEREQLRAMRSASAQIKLLDKRLGKSVGAVKERTRLQRLIDKAKKLGFPELAASKVDQEKMEADAKKRAREIEHELRQLRA